MEIVILSWLLHIDSIYADSVVFRKLFSLPPLLLYIPPFIWRCSLWKPLSSMSNPLWCSHVCWSRAREAWDYYDWRHHKHTFTEVHSLYIHFQISPFTIWVTTRMCQGTFMFTVNGLSGLKGTSQCGTRSGKPCLLLLQGCIRGRWFSADPGLLSHFLTLLFQSLAV